MTAGHVQLRLDFVTLKDAARFADAFGGLVFGKKRTTPAEADIIDEEEEPPEAA
jgi:hypothetical protein